MQIFWFCAGVALILGDNIFYGKLDFFREALAVERGAYIFGYQVRDPERYGVVEFGADGRAISLEEKPKQPKSHYAVPGLYVYDDRVAVFAAYLPRGTYEYTYLMRATTSGRFQAEPAVAYEMYFPEVWGRSAGATLLVR